MGIKRKMLDIGNQKFFLHFERRLKCKVFRTHCKDKIPKFRNKYSQKRNIGVSVPISTFMGLYAIFIFPRLVSLFCYRKNVGRSWDFINRSQTHKCWNWGWGCAISRKGIYKGDFRCGACVFKVRKNCFYDARKSTRVYKTQNYMLLSNLLMLILNKWSLKSQRQKSKRALSSFVLTSFLKTFSLQYNFFLIIF